jgi:two-component system sensor histidine kinase SenX3
MTAVVAGVLGVLAGAVVVAASHWSEREQRLGAAPPAPDPLDAVSRVLSVLPGAAFVVGPGATVLRGSPQAGAVGLLNGDRILVPAVADLVAQVRRDGVIREIDLEVPRRRLGRGVLHAHVRVAPLSSDLALVLVEDTSEAHRLDAVRRDLVANVSHELKTPVGALSLLAEAVQSASEEPEAVHRFATRMQNETLRLTNLVNDLIDLSRLQGSAPTASESLDVAHVVAEAVDATRLPAQARSIDVVVADAAACRVQGDKAQLVTALANLLTNAIAYSAPGTKVAVSTRVVDDGSGGVVEIAVSDQGIGIAREEQERIFERFYRADPARSRMTGGTGLGLAIVKHVCANHGGECTVWSAVGAGSTFTLRLPAIEVAPAGAGATPSAAAACAPAGVPAGRTGRR